MAVPLIKLPENDVLGNAAAHFFKSGNVLRSNNQGVDNLVDLIPTSGPNQTRVEYDLWYSIDDGNNVHGYVYTDAMTDFLYLRVARAHYANQIMKEASYHPITPEGERLFEHMASGSSDKYKLKPSASSHDFVVFLPGTNIYNDVVDVDKVKRAVAQGAYVKPHPITAPALLQRMRETYGEDRVLDVRASGHELLNSAAIVGCCMNSEMGVAAVAKGKTLYLFDKPGPHRTYTSIYKSLADGSRYSSDKLRSILSAPYSGLVSSSSKNPEDRIKAFFDHYKDLEHVSPKNPNT